MDAPTTEPTVRPLTAETWPEFERLFARRGDQGRCWCMWFRLAGKEWNSTRTAERKAAFAERAAAAPSPGLVAYDDGEPVGWVAVAPRAEHPRIPRSTVIVQDPDVPDCWSVTCFYIRPDHRGRGLATTLLAAAVDHAATHGAQHIEAYPVDAPDPVSSSVMFHGSLGLFTRAGFTEVGRRRGRPTVRLAVS
jgi:GNAT superfamily N-acetyltransferase